MPKWQGLDDMESCFRQFVYTVVGQIDSRRINERVREGEDENPTQRALQTCTFGPIQGQVWDL
jgi:hypothetical protein